MRITLTIPTAAIKAPSTSKTDPPLVQLAGTGERVLIELQGELGYEGDPCGRVVGLLGFERMDKPTLHLGKHHLLHGKIVTLPRPLCVIRRVKAHDRDSENEEEESDVSDSATAPARRTSTNRSKPTAVPSTPSKQRTSAIPPYLTPTHKRQPPAPETSSPVPAPNQRDYSSDLSSPFPTAKRMRMGSDEEDEEGPMRKVKRKTGGPARTREYETVAVVRRKIVFALRPEPIVTATVLPE
ncbi:hypothetical protein NCC49_001339 [Naganishia albida]|nr:hypothetical protein NCC49_001339 [Naganishia albida]